MRPFYQCSSLTLKNTLSVFPFVAITSLLLQYENSLFPVFIFVLLNLRAAKVILKQIEDSYSSDLSNICLRSLRIEKINLRTKRRLIFFRSVIYCALVWWICHHLSKQMHLSCNYIVNVNFFVQWYQQFYRKFSQNICWNLIFQWYCFKNFPLFIGFVWIYCFILEHPLNLIIFLSIDWWLFWVLVCLNIFFKNSILSSKKEVLKVDWGLFDFESTRPV